MRAKNMQKLTGQIKEARPGVTIYGIGDAEHKTRVSGHNEDDTPGVRAEDQDSDNIPEHRAIDVMIGPNFTRDDAVDLVADLVNKNGSRILYVNFEKLQYSKKNNWVGKDNSDNPHPTHVHISGDADDDENESAWNLPRLAQAGEVEDGKLDEDGILGPKTIRRWQKIMGTPIDGVITPKNSDLVRAVQRKLKETVNHRLVVDGDGIYQNGKPTKTIGALQDYLGAPIDQFLSVPVSVTVKALQRRLNDGRF